MVTRAWADFDGYGAPDRYLSEKLKFVKEAIKEWKWNDFDKEQKLLAELRENVNSIELLAEDRSLTDVEIADRRDSKQKILEIEKRKNMDI